MRDLIPFNVNIDRIEDWSDPQLGVNRARVFFTNGYWLSIVQGWFTYGGDMGLFELMLGRDDEKPMNNILGDDVLGWQSKEEVVGWIIKVGNL